MANLPLSGALTSLSDRVVREACRLGIGRAIVVNEFPKSGGTWVARMLAAGLDVAYDEGALRPWRGHEVVRSHWAPSPRFNPSVYVLRDGRDAMVSLFHHRFRHRHDSVAARRTAEVEQIVGAPLDPDRITEQMPRFLEAALAHPGDGSPLSWADHVRARFADGSGDEPGRAIVRYEALLTEPRRHLRRIVRTIGEDIDDAALDRALEAGAPSKATGRSAFRKGVAGEWREVFDDESRTTFARLTGDALVMTGYEVDDGWVTTPDREDVHD